MDVKTILVPVDFSDNSKKILESACFFADKLSATVHVIFVVQTFDDYSGFFVPHMPVAKFEEEMIRGAEEKMESFLKGCEQLTATVVAGDVGEEIIDYAEQNGIDMIVMGTHGYKGVEKIMFGSVADKVVKAAPCPVLTINPYK